jgi:hypothetical protein
VACLASRSEKSGMKLERKHDKTVMHGNIMTVNSISGLSELCPNFFGMDAWYKEVWNSSQQNIGRQLPHHPVPGLPPDRTSG